MQIIGKKVQNDLAESMRIGEENVVRLIVNAMYGDHFSLYVYSTRQKLKRFCVITKKANLPLSILVDWRCAVDACPLEL